MYSSAHVCRSRTYKYLDFLDQCQPREAIHRFVEVDGRERLAGEARSAFSASHCRPSWASGLWWGSWPRCQRWPRVFLAVKKARCRCPPSDSTYWGRVGSKSVLSFPSCLYTLFPTTGSCNHGRPNVHLSVPWGSVAYIQFAKTRRTGLHRLRPHLVFPWASCGLGVPRWFKVESRFGIGANFSHRVLLLDHMREVESRVSGVESWRDLSSCHCRKATRQLGHPLAGCEVQVHCLPR